MGVRSVTGTLGRLPEAHAHTLRHACGHKLPNDGHDTRAIIQNTTRYASVAPQRFKEFFRD
jgi:type 1 fimbriae regulatory protein FimE